MKHENKMDDKCVSVSIVTVVYNGEKVLEETILSIVNQSYTNIEFIIIDGGSTDGTIDVIKRYQEHISYWVSEPDKGIYDAMNKGVSKCSGDWVIFMNAGDRFATTDTLEDIGFSTVTKSNILVGDVAYESGKVFRSLAFPIYFKNSMHHQGVFYPRSLFDKYGSYSLEYDVLADYDFNFRLYAGGEKIVKIEQLIAICSDYGVSDIPKLKNYVEEIRIRKQYISSKIIVTLLAVYSLMRFAVKKFIRWI